MANRYDNGSVSKFNPLSFQELSVVPLMQRQKHDQLIAQQEMLRQGLAKVDPLDVHMNEALNVKSGIENKLSSQAELLGREGVNPNTQGEFLALNREYQNLIAPTGRLGQINAAKQVYAKNLNDYLEDAQKNKGWSRERALTNWNNFSKQYTGFEGDKITNIDQLGAPKKVEVMDVLKDVKSLLGEQVVGEMRASGYSFQPSPDGGMVMVDRSGRRIETSNRPNLQHAQNLINQKLVGKEWQDSIRFEGENTPNVYNQLTSGINSMLSTGVVDNRGENAQYIAPKETKDGDENGTGIPDSIPEKVITINDNENILRGLTNKSGNIPVGYSGGTGGASAQGKPIATKDTQLKSPEYIDLATKIKNQSPTLKGLNTNDERVVNATIEYLKNHRNTQTVNRIITPSTSKDTRGYSADEIAKYTKTKQDAMETSIRNGMKVYDENGDEIKNPKSKSIIYNGEYTFNSITPIKSTNPKTKFSPISATMINEKGEEQKVYVAQNPDREKDPLFKAQYTAFQTLDKANKYRGLKQPLKNTFTEENLGLRDVNVTYNDDGSVVLEGKHYNGKNWEEMPKQIYGNDSDFVNYIHNLYK